METARSVGKKTSRAKEVLAFWERRAGRKLSSRDASEMQSNVEGVMALLAQWDRADRAATRRKKNHDAPKD
jgi:hypothetical protein